MEWEDALHEANKRGLLSGDMKTAYDEAVSSGLLTSPEIAKPLKQRVAGAIGTYGEIPLEIGLGLGGGFLGSSAGPVGTVAGAAGGYAIGKKAAADLREYGQTGIKPTDSSMVRGSDVIEGAAIEAGGVPVGMAAKGLMKVGGKAVKPLLGALTGTGTGAIQVSIDAGRAGTEVFKRALRGQLTGKEIVDNAKDALAVIKDKRAAAYAQKLAGIAGNTRSIPLDPIKNKLDALMKQYNVARNADGSLDASRIAMGKSGRNDIEQIVEVVSQWGSKTGDDTAAGIDVLKRQLDDFYSDSSQARQFVTVLRQTVHDTISKAVPDYKTMTSEYARSTRLIKDIESGLMMRKQGISGRIVADQTLRRLTSALRDNFPLRKDLVEALGREGGQDLVAQIAGHSMSSFIPRGISGTGIGVFEMVIANTINPKIWPLLVASSPRAVGEFLRAYGKASVNVSIKAAGKAISYGYVQQKEGAE